MLTRILDKIIQFADQAHGLQTRKYTPERYIVHPVRVMHICRQYNEALPVLAAALLHDVLEDTDTDAVSMANFLNTLMSEAAAKSTLNLVVELTDVYVKSAYPQWNRHKRKTMELERMENTSAEAQTIKYADILDNCTEILKHDRSFGLRFLKECKAILVRADRGDSELRKRVMQVVDSGLASFGQPG